MFVDAIGMNKSQIYMQVLLNSQQSLTSIIATNRHKTPTAIMRD